MKSLDHLQINTIDGRLWCYHCGDSFPWNGCLPASIEMMEAISKTWRKLHKNCLLNENGKQAKETADRNWERSKIKFKATQDQLFNIVEYLVSIDRETFDNDIKKLPVEWCKKYDGILILWKLENVEDGYFFIRQHSPVFDIRYHIRACGAELLRTY